MLASLLLAALTADAAATVLPSAKERFAQDTKEIPDLQRHVLPLMGRMGCNGRACHGSFQGAGGFRLSLFGYDFKTDYEALVKGDKPRVDLEDPAASKVLRKPLLAMPHKGGKLLERDSWEYRMFERWVVAGAKEAPQKHAFKDLIVTPTSLAFLKPGDTAQLKVVAVWDNDVREDVTCLSRFRSNDESIAKVDKDGVVTCVGKGETHIVAFYDNGVEPISALLPMTAQHGAAYPAHPVRTKIDELVSGKLKRLGVLPSEVCTDAEFLRRVALDLAGTLPLPAETEAFLKSTDPEKRAKKIEELLKSPGYAAWWTTKLCDITGQSPRTINETLQTARPVIYRAWYDWIHDRVAKNTPYDQLAAGIALGTTLEKGMSYEQYCSTMSEMVRTKDTKPFVERDTMPIYWQRQNMQQPEDRALNFAHTFFGVRLQCAQCHKHPFDQWTQSDFQQFQAFFSRVRGTGLAPENAAARSAMLAKLNINEKDKDPKKNINQIINEAVNKPGAVLPFSQLRVEAEKKLPPRPVGKGNKKQPTGRVLTPKLLGGEEVVDGKYADPREAVVDWLRSEDHPYFAKAFVNRVWSHYFGVGIVEPADDMNLANPPSNGPLMEYLASEFIRKGYDMKWLHREICNSDAYQRSWKTNPSNKLDERNFSHALVRRLPAEIAVDALQIATAEPAQAVQWVQGNVERAIGNAPTPGKTGALPKGGRRAPDAFALRIFGKPVRETACDCERDPSPTLAQSLYLKNDVEVTNALNSPNSWLTKLALANGIRPDAVMPVPGAKPAKPVVERGGDVAGLKARIAAGEKLVARAKDPATRAKFEKQLAVVRAQLAALTVPPKKPGANLDVPLLVREAYLRTLCRYPTPEEMAIAREAVATAPNVVLGLKDVAWALLNTKEFIANH